MDDNNPSSRPYHHGQRVIISLCAVKAAIQFTMNRPILHQDAFRASIFVCNSPKYVVLPNANGAIEWIADNSVAGGNGSIQANPLLTRHVDEFIPVPQE